MSSFNATSNKNSGYSIPFRLKMIYEQVISSDMQLNTSVFQNIFQGYNGTLPATLEKKALVGKDLGLGFDLGLTLPKEYSVYSQYS
jgi:hypothetical protein